MWTATGTQLGWCGTQLSIDKTRLTSATHSDITSVGRRHCPVRLHARPDHPWRQAGEYSWVNKTDNESYKDDALDDAYRDYMPAIFVRPLGDTVTTDFVARICFQASATRCKNARDWLQWLHPIECTVTQYWCDHLSLSRVAYTGPKQNLKKRHTDKKEANWLSCLT